MEKIFTDLSKKVTILLSVHVDTGFNLKKLIYKQTLMPLTPVEVAF